MTSPGRNTRTVAVVVAALTLVIVGLILWKFFGQKGVPGVSTPVQIAARPLAEYAPASQDAVAALAAALAAGDETAVPAAALRAKNALMGLTVPTAARTAHLALILALSRFEQNPSPETRAALAAAVETFTR